MCRKFAFWGMLGLGAFAVLTYTRVGSYAGTAWSKVKVTAQRQVPVEFEIDRLKHEVPIWKHQKFSDGTNEWVGA